MITAGFCVAAGLVRRATSKAVCEVLAGALARDGTPDEILTDNGKVLHRPVRTPTRQRCCSTGSCARTGSSHRHTGGALAHHDRQDRAVPPEPAQGVLGRQERSPQWRPLSPSSMQRSPTTTSNRPHQSLEMATPAERFRLSPLVQDRLSRFPWIQADDHPGQWAFDAWASNGVVSVDNQMSRSATSYSSRARRRVRGRDHHPGLEQEPPHQDSRQSPVRARQEDQSRWTARQGSTGYEASSVSRNLTRRASSAR